MPEQLRPLHSLSLALAALAGSVLAPQAMAEEGPNILDAKFTSTLGVFVLDSRTKIRLDGEAGQVGTEFDWEEGFGGSNGSRFRWDGAWRFADRHKIRGMWFNFSREQTERFDTEVDWGDVTFPIGADVTGSLNFDIYELAYEYAFLRRENLELSGSIGFHLAKFGVGMKAVIETEEGGGTAEIGDDGELSAPLPVIGAHAIWRIGNNFWVDALVQLFALEYENYDGQLVDARIAVMWQPKEWLGLGIGYNRFDIDVDVDRERMNGSFEWIYDGPQFFYSVAF